jgi:hypothetical protein
MNAVIQSLGVALVCIIINQNAAAQGSFSIGLLKYRGGGDWYANPTSLPNLIAFTNKNLNASISAEPITVDAEDPALFTLPFVHMTGHGNVIFSQEEIENLRTYCMGGGFLHIDDNYGMDPFIRPQLKRIFPDLELMELPASHPLFHQRFDFPGGLPKIHEHDGKAPQAFGYIYEGRLMLLYTYECDLGDGWEDLSVHKDSDATRQKALKMGSNILQYVLLGNDPIKRTNP